MSSPRALLVDCDGVLIHSEPLNFLCWNRTFDEILGVSLDKNDYTQLVGLDLEGIFRLWCGSRAADLTSAVRRKLLARKQELFAAHASEGLEAMPGALAMLESARLGGMKVAVVSAALETRLQVTLEAIGVDHLVDFVLPGETVLPGNRKDFARAARELGAEPAECVAVDDSPAGVAAARSAGVNDVAGFTSSFSSQTLKAAGAHRAVDDLGLVLA